MTGKVTAALLGLVVLTGGFGCAKAPVLVFELDRVINAPGDDLTREELDVDVLLLKAEDAAAHPELLNGAMKSDEWFAKRDRDDATELEAKRILAYRRGESAAGDTRQETSFISGIDRQGQGPIRLATNHPEPGKGSIVIFGRWRSMEGTASRRPLVIRPLPGWNDEHELRIRVGREDFECLNCPE